MAKAKFLGAVGPFEVYKLGGVVIINRDGELSCNLRRGDPYFHSPLFKCELALRAEKEAREDAALEYARRRVRVVEYLAARAERAGRQFSMEF